MTLKNSPIWVKLISDSISLEPLKPINSHVKAKFNDLNEIGIIDKIYSPKQVQNRKRLSHSIKIAELISPKQRKSMLIRADVSSMLKVLEKTKTQDIKANFSLKLLKTSKPILDNFKKYEDSNRLLYDVQNKKATKENYLNPLFSQRINEVIETSKNLLKLSKKFSKKIEILKKQPCRKLKKVDKMKIAQQVKLKA